MRCQTCLTIQAPFFDVHSLSPVEVFQTHDDSGEPEDMDVMCSACTADNMMYGEVLGAVVVSACGSITTLASPSDLSTPVALVQLDAQRLAPEVGDRLMFLWESDEKECKCWSYSGPTVSLKNTDHMHINSVTYADDNPAAVDDSIVSDNADRARMEEEAQEMWDRR